MIKRELIDYTPDTPHWPAEAQAYFAGSYFKAGLRGMIFRLYSDGWIRCTMTNDEFAKARKKSRAMKRKMETEENHCELAKIKSRAMAVLRYQQNNT